MLFRWFRENRSVNFRKLNRLTADELQRERARLDQLLQRSQRELGSLEGAKAALFDRGRRVGGRERENLARQIQRMDASARNVSQRVQFVNRHLQVIEGFQSIRENQRLLKEMKVGSLISDLPIDQISRLAEQTAIEGRFEMERFTQVTQAFDAALEDSTSEAGDGELQRIVRAMEDAATPNVKEEETDAAQAHHAADRLPEFSREH